MERFTGIDQTRELIKLKEQLIQAAEVWFETITGGRFDDIPNKQFILLQIIEEYRAVKGTNR